MELNTKTLRIFVELAKTGSFSRAAKALGITQPAVSLQIQALERDLGLILVDRSRGRCRLTEAGKSFLHHAQKILREEELLQQKLEGMRNEVVGHLDIIASNIPGEYLLPRILPKYLEKYPMVRICLNISDSYNALEAVMEGHADIGFVGRPVDDEKLEVGVLCSDILMIIAPPGYELAREGQIKPKELAHANWVCREEGSGTRAHSEKALEEWGIRLNTNESLVLGSNTAVIQAVSSGAGISMVSLWAAADMVRAGKVVILKVPRLERRRHFFYVRLRRKPLTTVLRSFIEFLEGERPRLEDELEALRLAGTDNTGSV